MNSMVYGGKPAHSVRGGRKSGDVATGLFVGAVDAHLHGRDEYRKDRRRLARSGRTRRNQRMTSRVETDAYLAVAGLLGIGCALDARCRIINHRMGRRAGSSEAGQEREAGEQAFKHPDRRDSDAEADRPARSR